MGISQNLCHLNTISHRGQFPGGCGGYPRPGKVPPHCVQTEQNRILGVGSAGGRWAVRELLFGMFYCLSEELGFALPGRVGPPSMLVGNVL